MHTPSFNFNRDLFSYQQDENYSFFNISKITISFCFSTKICIISVSTNLDQKNYGF